jgi:hypothetical protein
VAVAATLRPLAAYAALALAAVAVAVAMLTAGSGSAPASAPQLQRSAQSVAPPPQRAKHDRGQLAADGCMVEQETVRFPTCVYGNPRSPKTVVLFGDSQALQWSPPLLALARRHGWRLVGRTRAGCPPAAVPFAYRCDKWRAGTLRRIERDRPDLVVTASGVAYQAIAGGRRLSGAANARALRDGYARTLRRLRATGAKVVVVKTQTWAPGSVVTCVQRSLSRLRRCAFAREQPTNRAFEARAARRTPGVRLIDPRDEICLARICPAVVDELLVYRDPHHLSATYARTLAPWLDRRLPRP